MNARNDRAGGVALEIDQKLSVLEKIAQIFNKNRVTWAVGASLLLFLKGITGDFHDIDIIMDEKDVPRVKQLLADFAAPQPQNPSEKYKTKVFLEYVADGVELDIMAGFVIVSGGREYAFPLRQEDIKEFASLRGTIIPLQSVAAWREYYSLMGRVEKVKLIDEHRACFPVENAFPICYDLKWNFQNTKNEVASVKIVILDAYTANPGDLSWGGLEELGELSVYDRTPENEILSRIGGAEIVLTNKTPLTRDTMKSCPNLRYIGVMATGYNIVDTVAAKELGIAVTNVPSYGTQSVSQTAIAMLLEICHHYQAHSDAVFAGEWCASPDFSFWKFPLIELAGKTMGVIGFGRIGQATAKIAEALGMSILACDAVQNPALESETCRYAGLDEVLCESDVVTLHCPLLPSTRGIINRESLAKMKKTAILINASRGELVVEQDLVDALNSGVIYHAAVDVVSQEPMQPDNPLLKAKNLFISPHIAGACKEARIKRVSISAENVRQFLGGTPVNLV